MLREQNFSDLVSTRHSVRAFKDSQITEKNFNEIMGTTIRAPSAGNLQSYHIFVVSKMEEKKKLVEAAHGQEYISEAPLVMIFCAEPKRCGTEYGSRGEELFCIQDATIACAYSQLSAHSLGLSSVWIGSFDEEKVSEILNLDKDLRPVAILPIGFSNETPEVTSRRPPEEIIHKI